MKALIFGSLFRHVLSGLGAVLVAKGWSEPGAVEEAAGAVGIIAGTALSIANKYRLSKGKRPIEF